MVSLTMITSFNPKSIQELKGLFHQLQIEDKDLRVFGSKKHKYQLLPTLTESDLRHFERVYGVQLPQDYRTFLMKIGNGGPGPDYGVLPLEDSVDEKVALRELFPWTDEVDTNRHQADHVEGLLQICDMGCAKYEYLVVNGPTYGTVWHGYSGHFIPTHLKFMDWYLKWANGLVEKALPILKNERAIASIQVGMTKTQVIEICGGRGTEREYGQWWGRNNTMLSFDHLATKFEIDERGILTRIVSQFI